MPSDDLWKDAEIIDTYTRREAIEDGILVQLSGPGYQGDPWIPAMVAEAGFRYPVAMTTTAFCSYVSPLEGDDEKLAPCQDIKGRLWDVLWMPARASPSCCRMRISWQQPGWVAL